jgi:hypothetical protein
MNIIPIERIEAVLYDYVKKILGPLAVEKNPIGYVWLKERPGVTAPCPG